MSVLASCLGGSYSPRVTALQRILLVVLLCWGIALLGGAAARAAPGWNDVKNVYGGIAAQVQRLHGSKQATLESEYPPLATALFFAVSLAVPAAGFPAAWVCTILACIAATALYAWKTFGAGDAIAFLGVLLATCVLLGIELVFGRYDVLIFLSVFLAWRSQRKGFDASAGAFLAIAACLKLVPLALVPIFFITTPASKRIRFVMSFLIATAASAIAPLLILQPSLFFQNLAYMEHFHAVRGVQIESTWSGLQLLANGLTHQHTRLLFDTGSYQNSALGRGTTIPAGAFGIAGILLCSWRTWKQRKPLERSPALSLCFVLTWLIAVSPVFSPQYVLWVLPLAMIAAVDQFEARRKANRDGILLLLLSLALLFATQWIYPLHYGALLAQKNLAMTLVLNARNLGMIILAFLLWQAREWQEPSRPRR